MSQLVTIIMATYNRAHFIGEMLDSILNQSYTNWECIIINDGGTDDTDLVVQKYSEHDKRFRYVYRPQNYGKGLPGCRNYGLDIANGEYVVFFDDDDLVHPALLSYSIKGLYSGNFDFCQYQKQWFADKRPDINIIDEYSISRTIDYSSIADLITYKHAIASCTVLWKKSFLNERFDDKLQYAEEWEYYNRLFIHNQTFKGLVLNNVLYYNRKHPNSNTGEFYRSNKKRIHSQSSASYKLLCTYLDSEKVKQKSVIKYLLNILIRNRANELYQKSLIELKPKFTNKIGMISAYLFYPIYYPIYTLINKRG
jgi:GalNAc5-diNAcBac-PP-undecaprenol beta-1,3-glucosyltransferase